MRRTMWAGVAGLMALAAPGLANAQERIPLEDAQKYAKMLTEQAAKQADLAFTADLDTDKPFGIHQDRFGVMVVPAKGLKADAIDKAGAEVTPLGHLWMRELVPTVKDAPAESSKLRKLTIDVGDDKADVTLYLLGARKSAAGAPELVLFAAGKEPLVARPLEKADAAQSYPLEIDGREADNNQGELTFFASGKYRATLRVSPVN